MEKSAEMNRIAATKSKITFLSGRPLRKTIISLEDIVNLQIALNTSKSFEEFLSRV